MVRRIRQNGIMVAAVRFVLLFPAWLLSLLQYLARRLHRHVRVATRVLGLLVRPRNPNNLFVGGVEASLQAPESIPCAVSDHLAHERRSTLLWAGAQSPDSTEADLSASSISLWRGLKRAEGSEFRAPTQAVNHRFAYVNVLATQIKRLTPADIKDLDALIQRLARKWLDIDATFLPVERRRQLDVGRTLRYNIPRFAGRVLQFQWATKQRPVAHLSKPARILVIGDVSHSIVHYVSVILYFMHQLNFRFMVDSYVFSQRATHSTPYLKGSGTFLEKVQRLVSGARSWGSGTRFGTALADIAELATVDEHTYVIIATDGKVALHGDEATKIERSLRQLRARAKQVIFITPSVEFSNGASGKSKPHRMGSFKYDFYDLPIFEAGPPLWYGILGQYADRLYLVRTVQDLIDMTDDLIACSQD